MIPHNILGKLAPLRSLTLISLTIGLFLRSNATRFAVKSPPYPLKSVPKVSPNEWVTSSCNARF